MMKKALKKGECLMKLRKAKAEDIPAVLSIYEDAKASLRERGIDQWQNGYPNEASLRQDIEQDISYILEKDGQVIATACLAFGIEPTYCTIYEGKWLGEGDYGFLHRIAVSSQCKGQGAAGLFFQELKHQAEQNGVTVLRVDTHRDNLSMQRALEKNGFSRRGIIYLEDGSERIAFEWLAGSSL